MKSVLNASQNWSSHSSRPPPTSVQEAETALLTLAPQVSQLDSAKRTKLSALLLLALQAAGGDPQSMEYLVQTLENSEDLPRMPKEASLWSLLGAKQDITQCQLLYARYLIEGLVVPKDDYQALGWLVAAARSAESPIHEIQSATKIATLMLTSPEIPVDLSDLMNILIRAREKAGHAGYEFGGRAAVDVWQALALKGDPDGMFELGNVYASGEDVPANYEAAMHWYTKSAESGSWKGASGMLDLLQNPDLTKLYIQPTSNSSEILSKLQHCIEKGQSNEAFNLPNLSGVPRFGAPSNIVSGRIEGGSTGNVKIVSVDVGDIERMIGDFLNGSDDEKKRNAKSEIVGVLNEKVREVARGKAVAGDVDAMVEYALATDMVTEKESWLEKAAAKDNAKAMYELAKMLKATEPSKHVSWMTKSADLGYPDACYEVGVFFEEGINGSEADYAKAIAYYERAPDHGECLYRRAMLLKDGKVTTAYTTEFETLLKRAIAKGSMTACYAYGSHLANQASVNSPIDSISPVLRIPPSMEASRFIERACDHADIGEARDFKTLMDGVFKRVLGTHGREIIVEARSGSLSAQMELGFILKSLGLQGMAAVVFFGNLSSNNPDAQYEVARAFHLGIGDIKRHLLKAACWYYDAAINGKGASSIISLLALSDLFSKGHPDVTNTGISHAFPKNESLSKAYSDAALVLLNSMIAGSESLGISSISTSNLVIPEPIIPINVQGFLKAEKTDNIRNNVTMGILQVGEIEALLQAFPEGRATLGRGNSGRGGGNGGGIGGEGGEGDKWEEVDLAVNISVREAANKGGMESSVCCSVM
ncbi:hypothetical protein HDU76_005733 [Blyttiomyces sp. JEL0837]|nr:hypothetical protein HDU76_005733 [Blyttiomyces sp. JEL0837]